MVGSITLSIAFRGSLIFFAEPKQTENSEYPEYAMGYGRYCLGDPCDRFTEEHPGLVGRAHSVGSRCRTAGGPC